MSPGYQTAWPVRFRPERCARPSYQQGDSLWDRAPPARRTL